MNKLHMTKRSKKLDSRFSPKENKRNDRKGYYLGDISLRVLEGIWKSLDTNDAMRKGRISILATLLGALWMCQLRMSVPNMSSQSVDQLASYRKVKKSLTVRENAPVIYACSIVAALEVVALADLTSIEAVLEFAEKLRDEFAPNAKVLEQKNSRNYGQWCLGFMARQVGILSSSPSSNSKIFGFSPNDLENGPEELISKMGYFAEGIETKDVLAVLETAVFWGDDGFKASVLEFPNDPPMQSKVESALAEALGVSIERLGQNTFEARRKVETSSHSDLDYLNSFEKFRYDSAVRSGKRDVIKELNEVIKTRKEQSAADSPPKDPPIGSDDTQQPVVAKAVASKEEVTASPEAETPSQSLPLQGLIPSPKSRRPSRKSLGRTRPPSP